MSKNLILTADDYGACNFIDEGIIRAIKQRRINSVNVFVTYHDSRERIQRLKDLQTEMAAGGFNFGIGLHFSLTAGSPVLQIHNSLTTVRNGEAVFRNAKGYRFRQIEASELKRELTAQIDVLAGILGGHGRIDHVSNHHSIVYINNRLFRSYIDVIAEYAIPVRSPMSWMRSPFQPKDFDRQFSVPIVRLGIKLGFWKHFYQTTHKQILMRQKLIQQAKLTSPYCTCDVIYGNPSVQNIQKLLANYEIYDVSTEFMFHLGYSPGNVLPDKNETPWGINFDYFPKRIAELEALLSLDTESYSQVNRISFRGLAENDWLGPVALGL